MTVGELIAVLVRCPQNLPVVCADAVVTEAKIESALTDGTGLFMTGKLADVNRGKYPEVGVVVLE
jgi:hypothetical protein